MRYCANYHWSAHSPAFQPPYWEKTHKLAQFFTFGTSLSQYFSNLLRLLSNAARKQRALQICTQTWMERAPRFFTPPRGARLSFSSQIRAQSQICLNFVSPQIIHAS